MSAATPSPAPSDACAVRLEFDALLSVCARLAEDRPVEEMLGELLLQARWLTGAEAGAVMLVEKGSLRFICAQNAVRPDLSTAAAVADRSGLAKGGLKRRLLPMDDSSIAGWSASHAAALRLDDVHALPPGAPYAFDDTIDRQTGYRCRSMLVAPLVDSHGKVAGVLQLINRRHETGEVGPFTDQDERTAAGLASLAAISVRNTQMREEISRVHLDTILRLATAAEFRDTETSDHIRRVSLYSETISRALGASKEWARMMIFAAPMHDVGKLGVPDAVLLKPGALTPEERAIMQTHTTIGSRILSGSEDALTQMSQRIALTHHEKWDGSGYPNRLAGADIPLEGRIVAVADVFDALSSARVYKKAMPVGAAIAEVARSAGTHFDPEVARAFLGAREEIEGIFDLYRAGLAEAEAESKVLAPALVVNVPASRTKTPA